MTVHEVRRRTQADVLRARPDYLAPFAHHECSVARAAELLGVPLPRLHYWVGRFVSVGLLTCTRTQARAGRPIKLYRAVADTFHVPADLLDERPAAQVLRAALETYLASTAPTRHSGAPEAWITYEPGALHARSQIFTPARSAGIARPEHWLSTELHLTEAEAAAMLGELLDVVSRYNGLHGEDRELPAHQLLMCQAPVREA